jgi:hypothetical protein
MAIQRHNEAVRIIQKSVTTSGSFGGCYCIMDACPAGSLPPGVDNTRVPPWLVPADHPQAQELTTMRPDIVFLSGIPSNLAHGKSDADNRATVRLSTKRM